MERAPERKPLLVPCEARLRFESYWFVELSAAGATGR